MLCFQSPGNIGAAVIGLCMDDDGITHDPQKRLAIAEKIISRAIKYGIKAEDVVIDPLAMAVSADPKACLVTLETIRLIHQKLGHNITQGASNISFGLPGRESLNAAYYGYLNLQWSDMSYCKSGKNHSNGPRNRPGVRKG